MFPFFQSGNILINFVCNEYSFKFRFFKQWQILIVVPPTVDGNDVVIEDICSVS